MGFMMPMSAGKGLVKLLKVLVEEGEKFNLPISTVISQFLSMFLPILIIPPGDGYAEYVHSMISKSILESLTRVVISGCIQTALSTRG